MESSPSVLGLNGIDLLMAVVVAISVYIRRNDGIVAELFKLFGVLCTVFITLHYYVRFANFLEDQFFGNEVNAEMFAFCLLSVLFFVAFALISNGWDLILRIKSFGWLDNWGNVALSMVRGYFICSMIFLALLLTGNEQVGTLAVKSVSRVIFQKGAVSFYRATYGGIIKDFFQAEKINEKVFKLIGEESGFADD